MKINAIVASLEGIESARLDDPEFMAAALKTAVLAGGFELLHLYVHRFSPQGVTAMAVLSESHIALHSWPEEGALFVDVATCSGLRATETAFHSLCSVYEPQHIDRRDADVQSRNNKGSAVERRSLSA